MAKNATKKREEVEDVTNDDLVDSIVDFSEDLSDVEAPAPLPKGNYTGVIRTATKKVSKERGTKFAEIMFVISSDQYPADYTDGDPNGTTIAYRRVSLEDNPRARYGTRLFIESIGAPLGKRIDLTEWAGLEANVEVDHETYEGVDRPIIRRVMAV